ncbi:MAG: hypothetical protein ACKO9Z_10885 [Planctomycetota bacterium]
MRRRLPSRNGIMSVWLLVVIAFMTAVLALVAREILKGRELAAGREAELKADWLALGALEYGRSRLESNAAEGSLDLPEGLSGGGKATVAWSRMGDNAVLLRSEGGAGEPPAARKSRFTVALVRQKDRWAPSGPVERHEGKFAPR